MSTDLFFSQPAPRSPGTDFQSDKIGSFGINLSSKTKISRDSVKGDRDKFLNTLKQVTQDRVSKKRLKFVSDESSPVTDAPFDIREMDEAWPDQIAPDWKFMEKTVEAAPSPKETESGQWILRNQIKDQIIRKAAIHLRTGQHEAIIDLKSDFLGHIRMQVISENQQVTVKILAEHGFVKDMIESNLHQLKADLQQQGLEVDKLEVTVSFDSEDSGSSKEKFARWRAGQGNADHQKNDDWKDKQQKDIRQPPRTADNAATVDYFA
jgi:flagellar hook-length control protein FliK